MRLALAVSLLALALGCTTQSAGQRCEQDLDCNASAGDVCRLASNPLSACEGNNCICCPANTAAAAAIPGCAPSTLRTDAGARD